MATDTAAAAPRGSNGGRKRRVTSADVARHAGLSRATVSYVLNDTPHQAIPEVTRQRVRAAAAELGYTPSAAARTLSSGRSDVVLLLLPDWPIGFTVGQLLANLSTELADHRLTFVTHPRSARRPVADVWRAITPAAVVTFDDLEENEAAQIEAAGIELTVTLFGGRGDPRAMDVPEQRTGHLQAQHLAVSGHRHLGYAWPDDPRVHAFAQPRLDGVQQSCADLGLAAPHVVTVPLSVDGGAAAVAAWRHADLPATGICAYNDEVALAVLAGAHRLGLDIPNDLAVIGVDDIPAAALAAPALTTVQADMHALAHYISQSITSKLDGHPAPRRPGSDIHTVVCRESA